MKSEFNTALDNLKSVLTGPDGKCCISVSDEDRRIIDEALEILTRLGEPQQEQYLSHVPGAGPAPADTNVGEAVVDKAAE